MSESDWFLIAVMVWMIYTIAAITSCLAESDKWSDISMCAFIISIGIIENFMVSTWTW